MGDLTLALNGEYFDAIRDGSKVEEYRLRTDYWTRRLVGPAGAPRTYDRIVLTRGYPPRGDASRRLVLPWRGYVCMSLQHPHFGPDVVQVFAIDVAGDPIR